MQEESREEDKCTGVEVDREVSQVGVHTDRFTYISFSQSLAHTVDIHLTLQRSHGCRTRTPCGADRRRALILTLNLVFVTLRAETFERLASIEPATRPTKSGWGEIWIVLFHIQNGISSCFNSIFCVNIFLDKSIKKSNNISARWFLCSGVNFHHYTNTSFLVS